MSRVARERRRVVVLVVWFVVLWCALWDEFTVANVASGIVVAVGLVLLIRLPAAGAWLGPARVRPVRAVGFFLYFLLQVVRSNVILARDVITPGSNIAPGIIGVPLRDCSDALVTLVANAFTLTPGSITIEVSRDPTVIYVHVLYLSDVEGARAELLRLAELAVRAFGTEAAIAHLDANAGVPGPEARR